MSPQCTWKFDTDYDYWETTCNHTFTFIMHNGAFDPHFLFCPFCGNPLVAVAEPGPPQTHDLREALAYLAHQQWSHGMQYLFRKSQYHSDGTVTIPAPLVTRWKRQSSTQYHDLPPHEQDSNRIEADTVLCLLYAHITNMKKENTIYTITPEGDHFDQGGIDE